MDIESNILAGFFANTQKRPNAPALFVEEEMYTYSQLSCYANYLCQELKKHNILNCIGVYAYRSLGMYASILSIVSIGKTYVPINPEHPRARCAKTISKAGVQTILTEVKHLNRLLELIPSGEDYWVMVVDSDVSKVSRINNTTIVFFNQRAGMAPLETIAKSSPGDLAYLLFTSGSTGEPKGVGITHDNLIAFVQRMTTRYAFNPMDKFTQLFDYTFDLSAFDMFVCWTVGGTLYCVPKQHCLAPAAFVSQHQITVWFSVPFVLVFMKKLKILDKCDLSSLRYGLFCGEALPSVLVEEFAKVAPAAVIENLYGPTEATIAFTGYRWQREVRNVEENGLLSIGKPFDGLYAAIVDADGSVVPNGEIGELWLGGDQVSSGYWHNQELTDEQFFRSTLSIAPTEILWYKTGDLAKQAPSGDILFLGRADDQVQIAGYRVELGEVEHALRRHPDVIHASALAWAPTTQEPLRLVGFVCGEGLVAEELLRACARIVPGYMVPSLLRIVDEIPLNANGKVDKKALAATLSSV